MLSKERVLQLVAQTLDFRGEEISLGAWRNLRDRIDQAIRAQADAEPVDYDRVVSICEAHGIGLPVDCVEMVVEIVRLAHPSLPAAQGLSEKALQEVIRSLEVAHTGMCYGDEKRGSVTEYARGFGACIEGLKRALANRAATVAEPSAFRSAVERMVTMLEEGEWAEHVAVTTGKSDPLAQRLESAITKLINEASGDAE